MRDRHCDNSYSWLIKTIITAGLISIGVCTDHFVKSSMKRKANGHHRALFFN